MRRFEDLTEKQKNMAIHKALREIVDGLMKGTVRIKLSRENHNRYLAAALEEGRETGDFSRFHRYVQRIELFRREIDEMAHKSAKKAFYTDPGDYVIYGVAGEVFPYGL